MQAAVKPALVLIGIKFRIERAERFRLHQGQLHQAEARRIHQRAAQRQKKQFGMAGGVFAAACFFAQFSGLKGVPRQKRIGNAGFAHAALPGKADGFAPGLLF